MEIEQLIYCLSIDHLSPDEIEMTTALLGFLEVEALEEKASGIALYHKDELHLTDVKDELLTLASWISPDQMSIASRPDENWNSSWESSFNPIIIGDFCTIKASFHDIKPTTRYLITIDPEMAFGTGHHETTSSMIRLMQEVDFVDKSVVDYGTGTGILAILAEHLGAQSVFAFDYDEKATECATRCVNNNKCSRIRLATGIIDDFPCEEPYQIVLANINRNVLIDTSKKVAAWQESGGILLLSGILKADLEMIVTTYSACHYRMETKIEEGEWLCLKMIKT